MILLVGLSLGGGLLSALLSVRDHRKQIGFWTMMGSFLQVTGMVSLWGELPLLRPFLAIGQITLGIHTLSLPLAFRRSTVWHWLITIPASTCFAAAFATLPWAFLSAAGIQLPGIFLPILASLVGLLQSFGGRKEAWVIVGEPLTGARPRRISGKLQPHKDQPGLRIAIISDPHLGPFMSPERLSAICSRLLDHNPDLILLTGDFLTKDTEEDVEGLRKGLAPLSAHPAVFACRGNHDLEAPETVRIGLEQAGVQLLVNQEVQVRTRLGEVRVLGVDWAADVEKVFGGLSESVLPRITLLHEPAAFGKIPPKKSRLVVSGHLHGGQIGIGNWGLTALIWNSPARGLWSCNQNFHYIHRGTGSYGFPIRLGIPAEESLLILPIEPSPNQATPENG